MVAIPFRIAVFLRNHLPKWQSFVLSSNECGTWQLKYTIHIFFVCTFSNQQNERIYGYYDGPKPNNEIIVSKINFCLELKNNWFVFFFSLFFTFKFQFIILMEFENWFLQRWMKCVCFFFLGQKLLDVIYSTLNLQNDWRKLDQLNFEIRSSSYDYY